MAATTPEMGLTDAHKLRAVKRECLKCRAEAVCSERELARVYPSRTEAMRLVIREDTDATHLCCACGTAFQFVGETTGRDTPGPGDELTLAGAM